MVKNARINNKSLSPSTIKYLKILFQHFHAPVVSFLVGFVLFSHIENLRVNWTRIPVVPIPPSLPPPPPQVGPGQDIPYPFRPSGQTNSCENITFSCTTYLAGKNWSCINILVVTLCFQFNVCTGLNETLREKRIFTSSDVICYSSFTRFVVCVKQYLSRLQCPCYEEC